MLVSTLISTFIAGALLCTAAPTPDADAVDASSSIKYGWWIIHWPAADHRVDFHLGRGGAHHKVAIPPGKHPYVGHPAAFGEYLGAWWMKLGTVGTMSITDEFGTKMCLDPGSPPQPRNKVSMQYCTGGDQNWHAKNNSVIKLNNYDLCLDVPSGNLSKAFVQLWPCNAKNPNQIWKFEQPS